MDRTGRTKPRASQPMPSGIQWDWSHWERPTQGGSPMVLPTMPVTTATKMTSGSAEGEGGGRHRPTGLGKTDARISTTFIRRAAECDAALLAMTANR